mmetsp:Transcript_5942/g.7580  ORF Transcript_5942/g.7580 Transcript_5942/m.7580 type:complete len:159 (-) Transcript_5942:120-596(-)
MDTIHKCSTFTLRQELRKHGLFQDNYAGPINHSILLQKMIEILHNENEKINKKEFERMKECQVENNDFNEQMKQKRLELKLAAIERSRQRQNEKDYFAHKMISNQKGLMKAEEKRGIIENVETSDTEEMESSNDKKIDHENIDPFAMKFCPKISGRYA